MPQATLLCTCGPQHLYRESTYIELIYMLSFHDNLILMLLAQKEMYGYELMKSLAEFTSGIYEPKSGTLYPALKRLEKGGWISSAMREAEDNSLKKYYKTTEKGKKRLERMWTIISRIQDFRTKLNV